jgi:hypothetical protein
MFEATDRELDMHYGIERTERPTSPGVMNIVRAIHALSNISEEDALAIINALANKSCKIGGKFGDDIVHELDYLSTWIDELIEAIVLAAVFALPMVLYFYYM